MESFLAHFRDSTLRHTLTTSFATNLRLRHTILQCTTAAVTGNSGVFEKDKVRDGAYAVFALASSRALPDGQL